MEFNTTNFTNHTGHEILLSDDELGAVSVVKTIGSLLSLFGTLFIITAYLYLSYKLNEKDQTDGNSNNEEHHPQGKFKKLKLGFGHNLIFLLSLSDFIYSISSFIKTSGFEHKDIDLNVIDGGCVAQGFLINFAELSSICWTSMISLLIYMGTYYDITKLPKIYYYFFLYSYGAPLVFSFGPLFTNSYGPAGAWCWMNNEDLDDNAAWAWSLAIYIFSWCNIAFNIFAVFKTIRYFNIRAFEIKEEGNKKEYNFLKNFSIVLKFFPIILIICWIFPTINRIYTFISLKQNAFLYGLHIFFSSVNGFFNSIVYSYYYRSFIPCLKCYKGDEDIENKVESAGATPEPEIKKEYVKNVTEIEMEMGSIMDSKKVNENGNLSI